MEAQLLELAELVDREVGDGWASAAWVEAVSMRSGRYGLLWN
jgi:hypothetical protein